MLTIPLQLDLRGLPARAAEVVVEADLPLLAAHAGRDGPPAIARLAARLPDGRALPAQYRPGTAGGEVLLSLPAEVAALEGAAVTLTLAAEGDDNPQVVFSQGAASVDIWVSN